MEIMWTPRGESLFQDSSLIIPNRLICTEKQRALLRWPFEIKGSWPVEYFPESPPCVTLRVRVCVRVRERLCAWQKLPRDLV